MGNNKRGNYSGAVGGTIKEAYEAKVGLEAIKRAGQNKNLHGIVHEVLVKDSINANPINIMKGTKAVLSKSPTAVRDDILLKQGSKIVGRMQLKDTANSIGKTVKQVAQGHYKGTVLAGTKETAEAFSNEIAKKAVQGVKITQKMQSTGVSSADTVRIASKALGKSSTKVLSSAAKSSGAVGAAISGGIEVLSSGKDLLDGKISGGEFAGKVAKETVTGGASSAAGAVAATAATTAATGLLAATAAPIWVPAAIGVGAAIAVGSAVKGFFDFILD